MIVIPEERFVGAPYIEWVAHGYTLVGRTPSKRDQVVDEWLPPAQSKARVAVRLVHGCTATEGTHARSGV